MKITTIRVSAARTFNHPHESYANFRFEITQEAALQDGDDPDQCRAQLLEQTEAATEAHKQRILDDIERLRLIKQGESQLADLKRRKKQDDGIPEQIAKTEEALNKLTAQPLMLAGKVIHPGHEDHPATDPFSMEDDHHG